jgi:transcriptional regulator with XRE-family HTH domain
VSNIVIGKQLRAARTLARLTQTALATKAGFAPRAAKYWERQDDKLPTDVPDTLAAVEKTLREHGVVVFSDPTPGCRLINKP